MSRSKHETELCALLVDETYGELTSRIFTILLRRGRLSIGQLVVHTRLTKNQISHGLVVLIQQNLIYHYHTQDKADGPRTFYEANIDAAYVLVRSGKIVELIEERFGQHEKEVVRTLLLLGHAQVSHLEDHFANDKPHANGVNGEHKGANGMNGVKGNHEVKISSSAQLHHALSRLLESGYVEVLVERMFRSPTDAHDIVEKEFLQSTYGGQLKGPKQKVELLASVQNELRSRRDKHPEWRQAANMKRPADATNGVNGQGKKRRLSVNGNHDEGPQVDRNLVVRVNHEKVKVALRNQHLINLASSRIGETTSQIFATLLLLLEDRIPRCRRDPAIDDLEDDLHRPSVTSNQILAALDKSVQVSRGIGELGQDSADKSPKGKDKTHAEKVAVSGDGDVDMNGNIPEVVEEGAMSVDDPFQDARPAKRAKVTFADKLPKAKSKSDSHDDVYERGAHLQRHLKLLADDSYNFVGQVGVGSTNAWTVEFEPLMEKLRDTELDTIILENYGPGGHRLIRMLRSLGKLEEKALSSLALMRPAAIRTCMGEMQLAGMVDIQEVPRDASRTTQRTMFLWYFDALRATNVLVDGIYKAMSRHLQRLEVERRRASGILSMAERSDVRETSEEEVLSEEQIHMLKQIRAKEDRIMGQVTRLDDLIGVFRDF